MILFGAIVLEKNIVKELKKNQILGYRIIIEIEKN